MSAPVLLERVVDGISTLTLNRPEKRNALNAELVAELKQALDRAAADPRVRVVRIAGAGKDFCAGADLAEVERVAEKGYEESLRDARSLGELFLKVRRHPRPIVATVHGRALAGGCGLATACDLVLARQGAELGYPEIHLGFVPALVMTLLRRRVGEGKAFELVSLGRRYDANEALGLGLVNAVFPEFTYATEVDRYLTDLSSRPAGALGLAKQLLYELDEMGVEEGLERAAQVNAEARISEECRAGVRAFLAGSRRGGSAPEDGLT